MMTCLQATWKRLIYYFWIHSRELPLVFSPRKMVESNNARTTTAVDVSSSLPASRFDMSWRLTIQAPSLGHPWWSNLMSFLLESLYSVLNLYQRGWMVDFPKPTSTKCFIVYSLGHFPPKIMLRLLNTLKCQKSQIQILQPNESIMRVCCISRNATVMQSRH